MKRCRKPAAALLSLSLVLTLLMQGSVFATSDTSSGSDEDAVIVQESVSAETQEETTDDPAADASGSTAESTPTDAENAADNADSAESEGVLSAGDTVSETAAALSSSADETADGTAADAAAEEETTEEELLAEEAAETALSTLSTLDWSGTESDCTVSTSTDSDSSTEAATVTISGDGTLKLTGNTGASVTVSSGTVTIDLNNYSLSGNSGSATITVSSGANVTVKDSSSSQGGKVTHSSSTDSDGNSTTVYGCGVSVSGGTFTLESGSIYGNTAAVNSTGRGYGGGISAKNSATVYIKGGSVSYNTASLQGGGIYLISSSTLTISGGEISNNTVNTTSSVTATSGSKIGDGGAGGGIMAWDNATITMTGGSITYNQANSTSTEGGGGGVEIGNGTTFTMSGGTISHNSTTCGSVNGKGGGVFVSSADSSSKKSTFKMSGGSISNNSSGGIGGGIYVNTVAAQYTANNGINEVSITGGTISANTAGTGGKNLDGGGIYINCGTLTMTGGTISGNSAGNTASGGSGGGIFIASAIRSSYAYSSVTIGGSAAIIGNTAANGGGIHCQYSYLTIEGDALISNNTSTGNRGGGGVLVTYSSSFTMTGGTITGNSAEYGGGLSLNRGNGSTGQVGAGSYSLGQTDSSYDTTGTTVVNISGGVIANNTATTAAADVQFSEDSRSVSGAEGVFNITAFTLNDDVEYGSTGYRITGWFEDGSSARYADSSSPTAVTISEATGVTSEYFLIAAPVCYKSGHSWGTPVWTWTESSDGYTATATFTCANDSSHTATVTAAVTSVTADGYTTYTATATVPDGDTVYTDTLKVEVTAEGDVTHTEDVSASAPDVDYDVDVDTLKDETLTSDEASAVDAGGEAKYTLTVKTQEDDAVSDTDVALTESYLETDAVTAEYGDLTVGMYLDISLYLTVTDANGKVITDARQITNTKTATYTITVTVPESLINTDSSVTRTYEILRVHDGAAEILSSTLAENADGTITLTFETNKFSTYAILYTDTETASAEEETEDDNETVSDTAGDEEETADTADDDEDTDTDEEDTDTLADTGDAGNTLNLSAWIALLVLSGAVIALLCTRRRKA